MRQRTIWLGTFLAVTMPALVLAYGRASADAPSAAPSIPASAFQPVATQRPRQLATAGPAIVDVRAEQFGPAPSAAPRPAAAAPVAQPIVVPIATPRPPAVQPRVVAGAGTPSVADAKAYALSRIGSSQFNCLDALWTRESNWNPYARNSSSGAYGIPQALPGDKMATFGADWQTNPVTQVKWGLSYIAGRYGTACNAWAHSQTYGWY